MLSHVSEGFWHHKVTPAFFPLFLAYALCPLTQTLFCVCAVKFNQDDICWCLMWVIVLHSVRVCRKKVSMRRGKVFGEMSYVRHKMHFHYQCIVLLHMLPLTLIAPLFLSLFFCPAMWNVFLLWVDSLCDSVLVCVKSCARAITVLYEYTCNGQAVGMNFLLYNK